MSGSPAGRQGARPVDACASERDADLGLPLGQIIPGTQYRVLTKLGSGGMGTVYAAEHVRSEKRVAIKVLRADVGHTRQHAIDRLRDEARAASKIGSQFICDVTDFGQIPDGRVFFVMEYLEGHRSAGCCADGGALPPDRALPILRQIAKALEAAHEKGIVHLDMKPDNVDAAGARPAQRRGQGGRLRRGPPAERRPARRQGGGHARIRRARAVPGRGLRPPGRHLRAGRAGLRDA